MAKRDKQVSALIAVRTNITKWSNAIEDFTGGTKVNEVCGLSSEDWAKLNENDKWNNIVRYKSEHPQIKLKRNAKSFTPNFKSLAIQAAEATNDSERELILDKIKRYKEYEDAKNELDLALANYDKAKKRLNTAKEDLAKLEKALGI